MSFDRLDSVRQRVRNWRSNAVVAMGAAVVAIGLFVGVAAAKRAAGCDHADCVAEGIGQSAHDTGVAITEGAANAGRALRSGAHSLRIMLQTGRVARAENRGLDYSPSAHARIVQPAK